MAMSDELGKLGDLHQQGVLNDHEFARAKARVLGESGGRPPEPELAAINAFRRSRSDYWLGGVCGGLAQATGLAAWAWRLTFALLMLCVGSGALIYLLLWVFVPLDDTLVDRPLRTTG